MARPPLYARPPTDPAEERTLRKLAAARHAPASLIQRARIITASWDGASVPEVAQRLGCHPKTVYKWLHRLNQTHGMDGLADLPRPGLPRRITETERGRIIQLARTQPPGRLQQGGEGLLAPADPKAPAHWTLDTLTEAAQAEGIRVGRSQVRRILLAERVRWRRTRSWATSTDPEFAVGGGPGMAKVPPSVRWSGACPIEGVSRPRKPPTSASTLTKCRSCVSAWHAVDRPG